MPCTWEGVGTGIGIVIAADIVDKLPDEIQDLWDSRDAKEKKNPFFTHLSTTALTDHNFKVILSNAINGTYGVTQIFFIIP